MDIALRVPGVKGAQIASAGLGGCCMILASTCARDHLIATLASHGFGAERHAPVAGAGLVEVWAVPLHVVWPERRHLPPSGPDATQATGCGASAAGLGECPTRQPQRRALEGRIALGRWQLQGTQTPAGKRPRS